MTKYWEADLRFFGKQFSEKKGGYVYQDPAISAEDEFLSSLDEPAVDFAPEIFLAMKSLTPKQRFVIECRFGIGSRSSRLPLDEIADLMGISQPAVTRLIQRALRRLEVELHGL